MSQTIIPPSIGRVVWYFPHGTATKHNEQPHAAIVAFVHHERLVNLTTFDHHGHMAPASSVVLLQEGDEPPTGAFCTWMPYQLGQAAKAAALERQVASAKSERAHEPSEPAPTI